MSDVLRFPARRITSRIGPAHPMVCGAGAPVVNLDLLLRGAPAALRPEIVAGDLLAAGSNAAAAPVWAGRLADFRDLVAGRCIRGATAADLVENWRAQVRAAGIAEKARRRAGEAAVFRMFERMAAGLDPAGGRS